MEECTHNCETCSANCSSREKPNFAADLHPMARVKKVYAVVSGKGGVGKSLVTSLLAVAMQRRGYKAAVLDADITGPSIPKLFGITGKAMGSEDGLYPNLSKTGIQIMSTNLLLENDTDPVVWRGPVIAGMVKQFWTDVIWNDVDFMFVDMPPGTGDVPLTVFQSLPIDGIIVVSSPQQLVRVIVEKAVKMANMMNVPVLGLVENMSYVKCPDCGCEISVFGKSNIEKIADTFGIPVLARIPMEESTAAYVDSGDIESLDLPYLNTAAELVEGLL